MATYYFHAGNPALIAMFDRMTLSDLVAFIVRIATIRKIALTDGIAILQLCRDIFVDFSGCDQEIVALNVLDMSPGFIPVPVEDLLDPNIRD